MTEQLKAEAFVRSQRPALLEINIKKKKSGKIGLVKIRLPLNLQDWLGVLGELEEGDPFCVDCWGNLEDINRLGERLMHFNLTTGQPATEADYKAFNDIVGI